MYYNSNDRVESLFCRQQGGVQAPRIRTYLKLACLFFFSRRYISQDVTVEPERRGDRVAEKGLGASFHYVERR